MTTRTANRPALWSFAALAVASGPAATAQVDPEIESPVRGFVYLEPFEIRQEFVVELGAISDRLGLGTSPTLKAKSDRERVLAALTPELASACSILADGQAATFELVEIGFVRVDEKLGHTPDERPSIPREDALVGAVFASPRDAFPEKVDITWNLFPDSGGDVLAVVQLTTREATEFELMSFSRGDNRSTWELPIGFDSTPRMLSVAKVRRESRLAPTVAAAVFLLAGLVGLGLGFRRKEGRRNMLLAAALALTVGGGSLASAVRNHAAARVGEVEARGIAESLLHNIYHAFAFRDESAIFDTLAESVDGPLLEQLYLDVVRGLAVEEAGGPRVKVLEVTLVDCELQRSTTGGLHAGVTWVSAGNVGHWGHEHFRRNQYRGELRIDAVDDRWKVTEVEILEEERT